MRIVRMVALVAAVGCSSEPTLTPVIDYPAEGSLAYPFLGLDSLSLDIAKIGSAVNLNGTSVTVVDGRVAGELSVGTVEYAEDLVLHLTGTAGDSVFAYGRTCTFDVEAGSAEALEPHLYFSRQSRWATAPVPDEAARRGLYGYATADGAAIFAGGGSDVPTVLFDPHLGAFQPFGEPVAASDGKLQSLDDGRAVLIGGLDGAGAATQEVVVLDARQVGAFERIRFDSVANDAPAVDHAVEVIPPRGNSVAGFVLVTGGRVSTGGVSLSSGWTLVFDDGDVMAPTRVNGDMSVPRAGHAMVRLGDEAGGVVLIVGGLDSSGQPIAQAEIYRPQLGGFEIVAGAELVVPRWGHQVIRLPSGFALVIGGFTLEEGTGKQRLVPELELYDPAQGVFQVAGQLPANVGKVDFTLSTLPDESVLLAGGLVEVADTGQLVSSNTSSFIELDVVSGTLALLTTGNLGTARSQHRAVRLCDGTVLVVGGADELAAERFNPRELGRR